MIATTPQVATKNPFASDKDGKYLLPDDIVYYSERFKKTKTLKKGFKSDGASGPAEDIYSQGWWVHDGLYRDGVWDDGTECTEHDANLVLHDILKAEGRWFRAWSWLAATELCGRFFFHPVKHIKKITGVF
jgi:hypothetical protein